MGARDAAPVQAAARMRVAVFAPRWQQVGSVARGRACRPALRVGGSRGGRCGSQVGLAWGRASVGCCARSWGAESWVTPGRSPSAVWDAPWRSVVRWGRGAAFRPQQVGVGVGRQHALRLESTFWLAVGMGSGCLHLLNGLERHWHQCWALQWKHCCGSSEEENASGVTARSVRGWGFSLKFLRQMALLVFWKCACFSEET